MHAGRSRTAGIEQDRVAVGLRLGDILDRDRPGRTNLILDNDGTTDDRAQLLGKKRVMTSAPLPGGKPVTKWIS